MKVFVWAQIDNCSNNYHSDGGVVVFAEDEQSARHLARGKGCDIAAHETPDDVRDVINGGVTAVYIMPNAGCC